MPTSMDLNGQTVLITGSARRIGRALALYLAQAGADIIVHHSSSPEDAEKTAEDIRAIGRQAFTVQAELGDLENIPRFIDQIWNIHPFQHLVNSAAVFESLTWETTKPDDWQRTMNVNLAAPFFLSQQFARKLAGQPGRIVNLLDWRALRPGSDHLPYTISKAGLAALTRSLAQALAPKILVNALALGAILPPSDDKETVDLMKSIPAGRWAELDEVGQAVLYLLAGAAYTTGEIIHLDGGRHLV